MSVAFVTPVTQKSSSGQIRSHCKKLIASRTSRFVMHRHALVALLRRCLIRRRLAKSDRVGTKTRSVFHCAVVLLEVFKTVET